MNHRHECFAFQLHALVLAIRAVERPKRPLVLALLTLAMTGTAAAQPMRAKDDAAVDRWLQTNTNEFGQRCASHARRRTADRVLVACGRAGIWEIAVDSDAGPRLVRSYPVDGEAVGFFEEPDGRVWVKVEALRAQPLDSLVSGQASGARPSTAALPPISTPPTPREPTETKPPPLQSPSPITTRAKKRFGRVIAVGEGEVTVSLGSNDGIARGMRIALSIERREQIAEGQLAVSRDEIAIGVVTTATDDVSRVQLGLNEQVPSGAIAERTHSATTSSIVAPPRSSDLWELQLIGRPFVALGELGGGLLASASIGRRFEDHWHMVAQIDPFAFADAQNQDDIDKHGVTALSALAIGTYDSKFLELGLGIGTQSVNSPDTFTAPGSALAVAQVVRLGAVDGLNAAARTSIVLFDDEFSFNALVITGQIPVARRYWLLAGGGGGPIGYVYGEIGLRALLRGNGDAGSTFLIATAGGAGVFESDTCNESECTRGGGYAGPMAGIGAEWRF